MESTENNTLQHTAKKPRCTLGGWIVHITGIILCILFLPGFIVTATLLISSFLYPDIPPSFMGYTPLVVESDSMVPFFEGNDLVLIRNGKEGEAYERGDVICFRSGDVYVTHRIVRIDTDKNGDTVYTTRGDANNTPDVQPVRPEQILGSYAAHLEGLGGFVLFMQTPVDMIQCVLLPIFVLYCLFQVPPKIADRLAKRRQRAENLPIH